MKVLLLGDSIRMGYCGHVKELMQGKAEVFYPTDNGRFLQYTLRELQDWKANLRLDGNDVDVVHWNNGLWDVGHLGIGATGEAEAATADSNLHAGYYDYEKENLTPPDVYEYMIGRVYRRIRTLFPRAKVIFAFTTPVLEDQCPAFLYRCNAEVCEYNAIARRVLEPEGVLFNDLYSFADANLRELHRDWVHFNEVGSRKLAEEIVEFIQTH